MTINGVANNLQAPTGNFQGANGINITGQPAYQTPAINPANASGAIVVGGQPAATTSPQAGAGTAATNGTSSSTFDQPQYLAGVTQEYEGQLNADSKQAQANDAFYNTNKNLIGAQGDATAEGINQQAADSTNTLNTQEGVVGSQQKLSLAELADQIHGQNVALNNELGTVGAGSSSAVGTGQMALAHVQNQGSADINENAGGQVANIDAEKQAVGDQQKSQLDALEVWRQQQLTQIMQLYQQNQNSIDSAMQTAQGEEKARLAEFGVSLQTGVSAALQALDQQVQTGVTNITNYQVDNAPSIKAPVATPTPAAVTAPTASPFNVGNTGGDGNTTAAPTGGSLFALQQKLPQ